MKLLITGATGFVGRNLLLRAIAEGKYDTIYLPVRSEKKLVEQLAFDGIPNPPASVKPIASTAKEWNVKGLEVDHVIHSAGVIFAETWAEYEDVNTEGTMRLLRELKSPGRVILLSSNSAAGPSDPGQDKTERDADAPLTWYGKSKLEMEHRVAKEFPSLDYLSIRPPMIFGARDHATLPLFKMTKKPVHFKSGLRTKYYSYVAVEDLVTAIYTALRDPKPWARLPHRHFFVTSVEPISDRELIHLAAETCGRPSRLLVVPQTFLRLAAKVFRRIPTWRATIPSLSADRAKEVWPYRWVASSHAFREAFGWKPTQDFRETLKQTRDWYLRTGQLKD